MMMAFDVEKKEIKQSKEELLDMIRRMREVLSPIAAFSLEPSLKSEDDTDVICERTWRTNQGGLRRVIAEFTVGDSRTAAVLFDITKDW